MSETYDHRPLSWISLIGYSAVIFGAIGLEIRPSYNSHEIEITLTRIVSLLWVSGGIVAIPSAIRRHWLEKVGTSTVLGGTIIALTNALLLDVLPSWPPLSRPVLTIAGLFLGCLFFLARLIDIRHDRPRLPADEAIEKADKLRGMTA